MTNNQRQSLIMHLSSQLDYWTPRRHKSREAEEQFEYYTKKMKFLVTKFENEKTRVVQSGASLVFPSL